MGKRYFCDYCDRSFQDNLHNRKKHINGVQHQRARKAWFDLFRDAATALAEEQDKKVCRKFQQTGRCDFGNNCRFSHMSEEDLVRLKLQVEAEERRAKEKGASWKDCGIGAPIELWLSKRKKKIKPVPTSSSSESDENEISSFHLPPGLPPLQDLPPSLHPPSSGTWNFPSSIEWG